MIISEIRDYSKTIRGNPNYNPKNSYEWFRKQIYQLGQINTQKFVNKATFNIIIPGQMYLFQYDPKTKDKLPYWDKFPLIIPWNKDEKGFIGLNLHYLAPRTRLVLMAKLDKFKVMARDNQHKLLLQWNFINSVTKYPEVGPCIKRYLFDHVKSKFLKIPEEDWIISTQLPIHQFIKARDLTVWQQSRKRMYK